MSFWALAKNRQTDKIMSKNGYTYIITNKYNTTLYIGVTSNLVKRIWEHKNHVVEGFSKTYNLNKLVYYEIMNDIETAINREKFLKGKTKKFKIELIENFNPKWEDLYDSIT